MDWKGMNVTVKLTVVNRQATVSIIPSAPSVSPPKKSVKTSKKPPWTGRA